MLFYPDPFCWRFFLRLHFKLNRIPHHECDGGVLKIIGKTAYGSTTARNQAITKLEQVDLLLEKHEGDFEGLMLKASIEAEDYFDLELPGDTRRDFEQ